MGDIQVLDVTLESIIHSHLDVVERIDEELAESLEEHGSDVALQPLCRAFDQTRDLIAQQKSWIESCLAGSRQSEPIEPGEQQPRHEYEQKQPVYWKFYYEQDGLQFTVIAPQDDDDGGAAKAMVAANAKQAEMMETECKKLEEYCNHLQEMDQTIVPLLSGKTLNRSKVTPAALDNAWNTLIETRETATTLIGRVAESRGQIVGELYESGEFGVSKGDVKEATRRGKILG